MKNPHTKVFPVTKQQFPRDITEGWITTFPIQWPLILFHFIFSLINNLWRAIFFSSASHPASDPAHFIHEMTRTTDDGERTHIGRNWLVTLVYLHKIMPFFIVNCYNFLFLFNPRQNGSNNLLLHSKASHQTATTSQVKPDSQPKEAQELLYRFIRLMLFIQFTIGYMTGCYVRFGYDVLKVLRYFLQAENFFGFNFVYFHFWILRVKLLLLTMDQGEPYVLSKSLSGNVECPHICLQYSYQANPA